MRDLGRNQQQNLAMGQEGKKSIKGLIQVLCSAAKEMMASFMKMGEEGGDTD